MNTNNMSFPGTSVRNIPSTTVANMYIIPTTPAVQINTPVSPLLSNEIYTGGRRNGTQSGYNSVRSPTTRIVNTPNATNYPVTILPSMTGNPSSSISVSSPPSRLITPLSGRVTSPTTNMTTPLSGRVTSPTTNMTTPLSGRVTSPTTNMTTPLSGRVTSPTTNMTTPLSGRVTSPTTVIPPLVGPNTSRTPVMTAVSSPIPPSVRSPGTSNNLPLTLPISPISQPQPPLSPSQIKALSVKPSSPVKTIIGHASSTDNREQINNFIRNCPVDSLCMMVLNHMGTKHSDIKRTVGDIIRSTESLATLRNYLIQTGLLETLDTDDVVTILAPTNEAFLKATQDGYLSGKSIEEVRSILKKHVIVGKWSADMLKYQPNNTRIKSLVDGFYVRNDSTGIYMYGTKTQAKLSEKHVGYNGYVYEIDEVIL